MQALTGMESSWRAAEILTRHHRLGCRDGRRGVLLRGDQPVPRTTTIGAPTQQDVAAVAASVAHGRCLLALLASLHTLAACSAQQPTRSSYERQAEMEDAALAALADERSDHPQADPDESAQPSVANGGAADVMGQIGVALMSVLMTLVMRSCRC